MSKIWGRYAKSSLQDHRVRGTVATTVQWAVMPDFGWASEGVIDETDLCAPGNNEKGTILSTSVLNGRVFVGDKVNNRAPVGRLAMKDL